MNLNKLSDKIVFNSLKFIKHGNLKIINHDGKEYTFTLKKGLTCHDGEALTAEDAAYSFNRVADPEMALTGNSAGFVYK